MTLESLLSSIESFQAQALQSLDKADSPETLEKLRLEWFGKKGALTDFMKNLASLPNEAKPKVGAAVNQVRDSLGARMDVLSKDLESRALNAKLASEKVDVTLSGRKPASMLEHPVQIAMDELVRILENCGFVTEVGPECEHEYFNFDALNIPANHTARALQDTFYIKGRDGVVLRTHTSPVQIRTMLAQKPPIRMIAPGRVYRADYDATHSPMFHQIEGLLVDKNVNMGHLKGILATMVSEFFGVALKVRLRPSYFPFTEPSAEVDIQCCFCLGKGCKTCKNSGWLEIGGCGMVDPEVFKACEIDHESWRGFAFGMGIERMAMLKFGVNDLRSFYESDRKFIGEFARWRP